MNAAPPIAVPAFGFVSVIFSTEALPIETVAGVNALSTVGGESTTRVALLALAVPSLPVETLPLLLR